MKGASVTWYKSTDLHTANMDSTPAGTHNNNNNNKQTFQNAQLTN